MKMKVRKEREPLKKKAIAFRATSSIPEEYDSMDEDEEDEFAMLVRKVEKMFYKKERMSNFRRSRIQGKDELRKENTGSYYNCKKSGHLIADYLSQSNLLQEATQEKSYGINLGRLEERI